MHSKKALTMDDSILIVVNPTSSGGRGKLIADYIVSELRACEIDVSVRATERTGDAERITHQAINQPENRPACVVACGGDGTVQEVANALARARSTLGTACPVMALAPAGRCNDFARALGIPADPPGMVDTLVGGVPRAIDLGRVNDRYFCTVATVGIDAEVSSYVDGMGGPLKGTIAYLYGALCVLRTYRAKTVQLTGDFGTIERPMFLASSANTYLYGGSIPIAPHAVPTDGQLDVCVIDAVSTARALTLIPAVLTAQHAARPEVQFIRTRCLGIKTTEPLDIWADGERIGATPAIVDVVAGAVRVLMPNRAV